MILQNVLAHKIKVDQQNKTLPINDDALMGKVVNALFMFNPSGDFSFTDIDNTDTLIAGDTQYDQISGYINLTTQNGKHLFQNLPNSIISRQAFSHGEKARVLQINEKIDLTRSYINIKTQNATPQSILMMYAAYQNRAYRQATDKINGVVGVDIPFSETATDIYLSELVGHGLNGKFIRQIICNMLADDTSECYIDIYGKHGEHIQNIPLVFFNNYYTDTLYLDHIEIDFEKTVIRNYIRFDGQEQLTIHFIY